jgi:hypothetical protein
MVLDLKTRAVTIRSSHLEEGRLRTYGLTAITFKHVYNSNWGDSEPIERSITYIIYIFLPD